MHSLLIRCSVIAAVAHAISAANLRAEWLENGTPVSAAESWQYKAAMTSDGAGGAIIAWWDKRSGEWDIYCQRVDSLGDMLWALNGVPICTAASYQSEQQLAPDGSGGAFIVWKDHRNDNFDVYAQRIDANGVVLWATDGIPICTATGDQLNPAIVSDGAGGAYIAWKDYRTEMDDVYMQRVKADGSMRWASDGIAISLSPVHYNAAYPPQYARIASDDRGNALVVWCDWRSGKSRVYAQKVDTTGSALWTANGVQASGLAANAENAQHIHDGHGGAIITWETERIEDYHTDIYAQRIDSTGAVAWDSIGVPVCSSNGGFNLRPCIAQDGTGGAFIAWEDGGDALGGIAAQHLDANSSNLWRANGIYIRLAPSYQTNPQIVADSHNKAIIAWQDYFDLGIVRMQKFDENGNFLWGQDGIPLNNTGNEQSGELLLSNDQGGAIVSWTQIGASYDVYCTKIDALGNLPPLATLLLNCSTEVHENDIILRWTLSEDDPSIQFSIMKSRSENGPFVELLSPVVAGEGATYTYIDNDCEYGESYCYRVDVIEGGSRRLLFETGLVSVPIVPLTLYQNCPNPFNPTTKISYYLPLPTHMSMEVFDIAGRKVAALVNVKQDKGFHEVEWNARASDGNPLSSGVYFYRLIAGKEKQTRKMLLLQ